jgi:hypothetical protein
MHNVGQETFGTVGVSGPATLVIFGTHNTVIAVVRKLDRAAFGGSNLTQISFRITNEFDFVSRGIGHLCRGTLSKVPSAIRLWKKYRRAVLQLCQPAVANPLLGGFVKTTAGFRVTVNCV